MDDGRLTDGQGRTVDFKNTVLIMTSNIPGGRAGVEANFKPEFINRLDDIVEFDPLSREQLREIVDLQVARLIVRVAERGVDVHLTDAARDLLGELGYDPAYGARPLKRVISKRLVDPLALALLKGEFAAGDRIEVDAEDGDLRFERTRVSEPEPAVGLILRLHLDRSAARAARPSGCRPGSWSNWIVQTPTCGLFLNGNCFRLTEKSPQSPVGRPIRTVFLDLPANT